MEKIKLPLYQILELEQEILGYDKPNVLEGEKKHVNGFVELEINGAIKYYTHRLLLKIQEEKKLIESSKMELLTSICERVSRWTIYNYLIPNFAFTL